MHATPELRWIVRTVEMQNPNWPDRYTVGGDGLLIKPPKIINSTIQVLQQKWVGLFPDGNIQTIIWRDVPVEKSA